MRKVSLILIAKRLIFCASLDSVLVPSMSLRANEASSLQIFTKDEDHLVQNIHRS
jgi:hypothetical protein